MNNPIFFNFFSGSPLPMNDPFEQLWMQTEEAAEDFCLDVADPDQMECEGPFLQINPSLEPFFLGALFGDTLIVGENTPP